LTVTVDHKIAVNIGNKIHWKEAQYLTEDDDVVFFNTTIYNKINCELYGMEYVNHGAWKSDLVNKGVAISKSLKYNHKIRMETRNKQKLEDFQNFKTRIHDILRKYQNRHVSIIMKFARIYVRGRHTRKQAVVEFLTNSPDIFGHLDISWIKLLLKHMYSRKFNLKKLKLKYKYGETFLYKLGNAKKSKNGFRKQLFRHNVITRKLERAKGKTPLHTAKKLYRNEVGRNTKRQIKEFGLENISLVDKYNYNIDHIVPVMYGFNNGIPAQLIGDIRNLIVIPKITNIKKRCNINYEHVDIELFKEWL
jgi:hypothetical protein